MAAQKVTTRKWTSEEEARYRNLSPAGEEKTPLNSVRNLGMITANPGMYNRWRERQVEQVMALWYQGEPVDDIADELGRRPIEVINLVYFLGECGKIGPREGGLLGRDYGIKKLGVLETKK